MKVDPLRVGVALTAILYVISLFLPACFDAKNQEPMTGLACVLWFAVNLFFIECWANVALIFSLLALVNPKSTATSVSSFAANERLNVSVFFTMASIALASVFFVRYELPIGSAATSVPIVIGSGNYVWLSSMITLFVSQVWAIRKRQIRPSLVSERDVTGNE